MGKPTLTYNLDRQGEHVCLTLAAERLTQGRSTAPCSTHSLRDYGFLIRIARRSRTSNRAVRVFLA